LTPLVADAYTFDVSPRRQLGRKSGFTLGVAFRCRPRLRSPETHAAAKSASVIGCIASPHRVRARWHATVKL